MSVGMSLVFNAHFYFSPTARFQWGYSTLKSVEISSKISSTRGGVPALVRGTEGPSEARCCWREKWSGAGLLNLPALFALADFHLFSVIYAALSCAAMCTFAGYSAPRVHQEFVIAILPRTDLDGLFKVALSKACQSVVVVIPFGGSALR